MNEGTQAFHLHVGKAYGRVPTCGPPEKPKIDYKSFTRARDTALLLSVKFDSPLEPYPCYWCDGWHVGRALTMEEIERFMKELAAMTDR
jgi:hypothetical protein